MNTEDDKIYKETDKYIMTGLSSTEILDKQKKYGKNILPKEKKKSIFKIFILEFVDPIIFLMVIAIIFSFLINEYIDAIAIIFIILIDALLGTLQEWKAGKSADALKNLIKVKTKVLRDGKEKEIDAEELVVGDIVFLETGNKASADLLLISSKNLTIDESFLTGESINISKTREENNKIYAGSSVITGRGKCVVIAIGINTEIGKIVDKVLETKPIKSPLSTRMDSFTKQITILIIIISIIITIVLLLKNIAPSEVFLSVVALSVSAMPEGLPLALTLALTIGAMRMGKKNVIVKKLDAVESLGSCTVIASDKTGTLTVNEQTAKKIVLPDDSIFNIEGTGYSDQGKVIPTLNSNLDLAYEIGKLGFVNNEALFYKKNNQWETYGDSIDIAFKALGYKLNVNTSKITKISEIPYESENKYSAYFYNEDNQDLCTIKGSLEKIFEFCTTMKIGNEIVPLDKEKIIKQNEYLAAEGYRVIALAKGLFSKKNTEEYESNDITNMTFIGLVGFIDPIRVETIDSIKSCKNAGIKVIMITGDHPLTAFSIGKDLGLTNNFDQVITGKEIEEYLNKGHEYFDDFIKDKKIFSRVTPIQKLEIVESLKRQGEFVAVTGDGVNDAPAIKTANIGIAMGSGTDVAKETSNMIIIDDNFLSIVEVIKEGRNAYNNIRKVVYMLISCGIAEVFFFVISIITDLPIPLLAIQLLWLNLVTDGLQDIALSFEKQEKNIMNEKPRNPKEKLFDKLLLQETILSGLFIGILVYILWFILIKEVNMNANIARGYIMAFMVFLQNLHMLNCRSEKVSVFKLSLFANPLVLITLIGSIGLQILVMEVPFLSMFLKTSSIPLDHMLVLLLFSTPIILVMEIFKKIKFEKRKEVN